MSPREIFFGVLSLIFIRVVFSFMSSEEAVVNEERSFSDNEKVSEAIQEDGLEEDYPEEKIDIIINIADLIGYDWRSENASFKYGCPPEENCVCTPEECFYGQVWWNSASEDLTVWITENSFLNEEVLKYVIYHEVAHIWQIRNRGIDSRYLDFSRWDFRGVDPMEATADCLASAWGAAGYIYYDCPFDAQRYIHQLYLESLR